ncbi:MAG: HAD-IIIA family hydrolase [Candidatus Schekmanbacteria bacterium]|nr:MAG: HAD-IIIA family hydrolase [Candidatus Schekmanbacteria bacterium]
MFVLTDRDGVINKNCDGDYIKRWEDFEFLPGAIDALKRLAREGVMCAIISNQSGVGKNVMTKEELYEVDKRMHEELRKNGCVVEKTYYCIHRPEEGCSCRKPMPGLLLEACREMNVNPKEGFFIGDYYTDIEAGYSAGMRTILVRSGRGEKALLDKEEWKVAPDFIADNLEEAVDIILNLKEKG